MINGPLTSPWAGMGIVGAQGVQVSSYGRQSVVHAPPLRTQTTPPATFTYFG